MLSATPSGQIERPDLESNQDQDLRRVLCIRYTIGTITPRADDWIRTSMNPLTRRMPFLIEPRRH